MVQNVEWASSDIWCDSLARSCWYSQEMGEVQPPSFADHSARGVDSLP